MTNQENITYRSAALPLVDDRGWCLCLSGGGFRATLFHLGAILRMNELGVLTRLSTVTSVSGGSILNGVLATRWARLNAGPDGVYTNLSKEIVTPIRDFCSKDLRSRILLGTRLNPLNWPALVRDSLSVSANFLADHYEPLFDSLLSDLPLPGSDVPRFIFCATNVRSGACWHFHGGPQARMGDYYVGYCDAGRIRVSEAVAASSSFPPGFGAFRLKIPKNSVMSRNDPWGEKRGNSAKRVNEQGASSASPILLTDGGIYDNLAVEPIWKRYKTLLVSDAGRPFDSNSGGGQFVFTRLKRAADISMEQVAAVRKRWLVDDLINNNRAGTIWTLNTRIQDFPISDACGYGLEARKLLHIVRTDLNAFSEGEIACLVNHGYSLADAALRAHVPTLCQNIGAPFVWPSETWGTDAKLTEALTGSHRRRLMQGIWKYLSFRAPRYKG